MVITTTQQLNQFLQTFNYQCFAFDTETNKLDWFTQNLIGLSLYDGKNVCYIELNSDNWFALWPILRSVFYQAKVILGCNLVFDFKSLMRVTSIDIDKILLQTKFIDVQLAQYLINSEEPKSLEAMTLKYLNKQKISWKDVEKGRIKLSDKCIEDSINTWDLWPKLKPLLEQSGQMQVFDIECAFIPVQVEMETQGILIDQELLKQQEAQLEILKCDLEERMCKALELDVFYQSELFGGKTLIMPLDFGSPQAVANFIQKRMGIQLEIKTKTGYSVGKKTVEQLLNKHPFFPLFQKYQAVRKLLTSYVRPYWDLIKSDGKIYPSFHNVRSGRGVCSKPNLQQLARVNDLVPEINIRKLFIAGENQRLGKNDYSGQELRILAHITQDKTLIDAFNREKDVHLDTANRIFNLHISETDLLESSPNYKTIKKKYENQRYDAKTINFGIAYGKRSEFTETWFNFYPQVKKAIYKCKDFQRLNGFTVTWAGRRRYYNKYGTFNKETNQWAFKPTYLRSGFNMLIQGTGADMAKKAAGEIWGYLRTFCPDVRIILLVHDEIVLRGTEEKLKQVLEPVQNLMINTMQLSVPLAVESKIVNTYGD